MQLFCFLLLIFASVFQTLYSESTRSWESTEFVWNLGIASRFITKENQDPYERYKQGFKLPTIINDNQHIFWIRPELFAQFLSTTKSKLDKPIILVVCDGDLSFPSECIDNSKDLEDLLNDNNIVHIFAQNCDYKGDNNKISPIPIGIDFHTIAYNNSGIRYGHPPTSPKEQELLLKKILFSLTPTHLRKKRIFVDFHLSDTMKTGDLKRDRQFGENRTIIFKKLLNTGLIDFIEKPLSKFRLWQKKGSYAFSVSPHGNGLDCHRTWEDLVLGCIVIVKTSSIDILYEGLPVVIVKDWDEINEAALEVWLKQHSGAFTNPNYRKKLANQYWIDKILNTLNNSEAFSSYKNHFRKQGLLYEKFDL